MALGPVSVDEHGYELVGLGQMAEHEQRSAQADVGQWAR